MAIERLSAGWSEQVAKAEQVLEKVAVAPLGSILVGALRVLDGARHMFLTVAG